jgi:GMP synthase-like glutamine amidotransferase
MCMKKTVILFCKKKTRFLQKALQEKIPILGICLGAQLLSKAAGGKVTTSPQGEIGWFTVDVTEEGQRDPLFKDLPSPLEVYQWHNDMCQPPEGAVILASSVRCPVQAFRWGKQAYGLQFHAEITEKSIHDWSPALPATVREQEHAKMLQRFCTIKKSFLKRGEHMAENFFRIMKGL